MNRRIALLLAAVVIAALGTSLVFAYVRTADERAVKAQEPMSVLIAKVPIAAGTRASDAASQGAFELKELPAGAVPADALSSIEPVQDSVALAPIFAGQQIQSAMFGATAAASASTLALQPGQLAASFQFGDPQRVAGFVKPGSKVVVFLTGAIEGTEDATRVLLPEATVIAVGPTTITPPADASQANPEVLPRALLTLALSQKDAEKMIHASSKGSLYLGLLSDSSSVTPDGGVSAGNLFAQGR